MISRINKVSEYAGLSTDSKPTNVENGAKFVEMDTGKIYRFDKANTTWEQTYPTPTE